MEHYNDIYTRAAQRKGGDRQLEALLYPPLSSAQLLSVDDNQWLEAFTRKVFQSGFYWSVIDKKWPGFREVFWDFDIQRLMMMPPELWEQKAADERIVRNYKKVQTIAINAAMINFCANDHGKPFHVLIAEWPVEDIVGLWGWLKKHGARLGGNTGAYTLRAMGKDTFILSRDVEAYLRAYKIIDGGLQSKKSLVAIQAFFNELHQQSGRSLQELSQIIAYGVGENQVGVG